MDIDTTPSPPTSDGLCLDWRKAQVLNRRAHCSSCHGLTLLRHPDTGRPCHKVCAEVEQLATHRRAQRAYDQA